MQDLDERQRQQQNEDYARARADAQARVAQCQANWRQASSDNDAGNQLFDAGNPGGAIDFYNRAIATFGICGDSKNIAIVRINLANASARYAAVRPDNRVRDAEQRYGGANVYDAKANPFANSKSAAAGGPAAADSPIDAAAISALAKKRCAYAESTPTVWQTCLRQQEARAIMAADPAIRDDCSMEPSQAAIEDCALKTAARRVAGDDQDNCYFKANGANCINGGPGPSKAANQMRMSLRHELDRALAERDTPDEAAPGAPPANADAPQQATAGPKVADSGATPQPDWDQNDPLQHYLHLRNTNSDRLNNGDLGKPLPGFIGLTPLGSEQ
ncbi:MAG: hypothetical protein E7774_00950 [Bradyrhizobium sp.]|nr:MAG: hypothetical protein E7774_00950 [Bradyrhizobium sp.]